MIHFEFFYFYFCLIRKDLCRNTINIVANQFKLNSLGIIEYDIHNKFGIFQKGYLIILKKIE